MALLGDSVFQILSERIEGVISGSTTLAALEMHKRIFHAIRNRQPVKAETLIREDVQITGASLSQLSPETLNQLASRYPRHH